MCKAFEAVTAQQWSRAWQYSSKHAVVVLLEPKCCDGICVQRLCRVCEGFEQTTTQLVQGPCANHCAALESALCRCCIVACFGVAQLTYIWLQLHLQYSSV
jgi:hypothetical protein